MERSIRISKFRNIGLIKPEQLVLNYSLEKGKLGGLITIIGPNNAGKSNFLDALEVFGNGKFSSRDVSNLSFEPKDQIPELVLMAKDADEFYKYGFDYNGKTYIHYPIKGEEKGFEITETTDQELLLLKDTIRHYSVCQNQCKKIDEIISKDNKLKNDEKSKKIGELVGELKKIMDKDYYFPNSINSLSSSYPHSEIFKAFKINNLNEKDILSEKFKSKYGYDFIPHIYRYKESQITSIMLETNYSAIRTNSFYKALFKTIDMNFDSVENAYNHFAQTRHKGFLDKISKEINKKMTKLAEKFNKLYYMETVKYNFQIDLESERIYFKMSRGDTPIVIDNQSTGFKWFFNLYFNFLSSYPLNPGDIIISDEFATALHPEGQKELRKFIKDFGIKNDVLFVIATQSPFLADADNFDELRVVSLVENSAHISNSFTTVDHDDPDSLLPIKKSFTIGNHVLYDYDTMIVFVEGITDYNYLTMFKNLLGYKDIAFLPIEGVGKNEDQRKEIIKKLLSIRKHNSMVLVDGDKAGELLVKSCENTALDALSLIEIDKNFIEIENVFSEKDSVKHNLHAKSVGNSSLLKNFATLNDFDEKTKNNFKKVLDTLKNR